MNQWFSPKTAASSPIDYQVGVLQRVRSIASCLALRIGVKLAKAAALLDMPVVMTGSREDHIQAAVAPDMQAAAGQAYARRVKRKGIVNAGEDPAFRAAVGATGRKQLIIGAITTDISCGPGAERSARRVRGDRRLRVANGTCPRNSAATDAGRGRRADHRQHPDG